MICAEWRGVSFRAKYWRQAVRLLLSDLLARGWRGSDYPPVSPEARRIANGRLITVGPWRLLATRDFRDGAFMYHLDAWR